MHWRHCASSFSWQHCLQILFTILPGGGLSIPMTTAGHCDLHNEHINKVFKEIIGNMGANFTEEASTIAARAVTSLATISVAFDKNSGIHPEASAHSTRSDMD